LIPKAVAIEMATEEAKVTVTVTGVAEGTALEPEAAVALEVIVGAHVDALLGASTEVVMRA
jgi:hypothetical protein